MDLYCIYIYANRSEQDIDDQIAATDAPFEPSGTAVA